MAFGALDANRTFARRALVISCFAFTEEAEGCHTRTLARSGSPAKYRLNVLNPADR